MYLSFRLSIEAKSHIKASLLVMLSIAEAVREIKANSGSQFDPKVVESFLKAIQKPEVVAMLKRLPKPNPKRKVTIP